MRSAAVTVSSGRFLTNMTSRHADGESGVYAEATEIKIVIQHRRRATAWIIRKRTYGKKGEEMQITIIIDSFEELKKLRSLLGEKVEVNTIKQVSNDIKPQKTESKPAAKTGKKKIDTGKIKALKKAGWSVPKIADEMRCSVATVYNHLAEGK